MKELSIEEKACKYDEAYKKVAIRFGSNVADEIFQLNEDERIRKWIIGVLSTYEHDRNLRDTAIAWLEKQKPNNNPCKDCINQKGCINCENENLKETLNNGSYR